MLQELLHQHNIIIILLIYLCGKILPEGMGADRLLISEIINHFPKILLNLALAYGKHLLIRSNITLLRTVCILVSFANLNFTIYQTFYLQLYFRFISRLALIFPKSPERYIARTINIPQSNPRPAPATLS